MKAVRHEVRPTQQTDSHTCGYCAATSAYRYYGLDPQALELRTYLGTDHILPYNVPFRDQIEAWMGGTENTFSGTSPMDMFAVLYWDGFDVASATVGYPRYQNWLYDHLVNGDLAVAMMYSCLHWVLVTGMDDKGVWITDSCFTDDDFHDSGVKSCVYRLSHAEFAAEEHGVLMLRRNDDDPEVPKCREMGYSDFIREYARGLSFCAEILGKNIPRKLRNACHLLQKSKEESGLHV